MCRSGLSPDPAKVNTVLDWPVPQSRFEVRSFLGLANYFCRFIEDYAKVAKPLTSLLKGIAATDKRGRLLQRGKLSVAESERMKAEFQTVWTSACEAAFQTLKATLQSAPVLALPDFEKPFLVVCDACETAPAVGAVLLQDKHPVAFFSHQLVGAEAAYSASDIRMLPMIYALREWRVLPRRSEIRHRN